MNKVNPELKKIIKSVKEVQAQLQAMLKDRTFIEEARKYAEKQKKEVKKLFSGDAAKVRTFVERERKELERFQKQIPGEIQKVRKFVIAQRKELEKLLGRVAKVNGKPKGKKRKSGTQRRSKSRSAGARKASASSSS